MTHAPYIHPVHQVNDGIMTSYSKRKIDFNFPMAEMICLEDIAKGLSNICRYGGQMEHHYSVAQHSVLVMMLAPVELRLAALLNDAAEAYLGDVVKPLKNMLKGYEEIEANFQRAIFDHFNIAPGDIDLIKPYD